MNTGIVAIIIVGIVIVLYATNVVPYAVTSMIGCVSMVVFGVIPPSTAFSGFGSDTFMLVAGMLIMGNALFETGAARILGNVLSKFCGRSERLFLVICLIFSAVLTAFCSNTVVVALMMPVVSAAARVNSKIQKKNCYMAIGFTAVCGGGLTMVGSTPQLAAQGILESAGIRPIGFFEMTLLGLPRVIVIIVFFATIGYAMQKKLFTFDEVVEAGEAENASGENQPPKWKAYTALGILGACVVSFVAQFFSVGTTALVGAMLCVLTGCIGWKKMIKTMDWNMLIIVGGAIGFATGLDKSGGGAMIANFVVGLLGGNVSYFVLIVIFVLLATILGNLMSHTATASILVPIAIAMTTQLGYDGTMIAIAIILGICMSSVTPFATAVITMTMKAGYRFSDYVKVGGLLNVINFFVTIGAFYLAIHVL